MDTDSVKYGDSILCGMKMSASCLSEVSAVMGPEGFWVLCHSIMIDHGTMATLMECHTDAMAPSPNRRLKATRAQYPALWTVLLTYFVLPVFHFNASETTREAGT